MAENIKRPNYRKIQQIQFPVCQLNGQVNIGRRSQADLTFQFSLSLKRGRLLPAGYALHNLCHGEERKMRAFPKQSRLYKRRVGLRLACFLRFPKLPVSRSGVSLGQQEIRDSTDQHLSQQRNVRNREEVSPVTSESQWERRREFLLDVTVQRLLICDSMYF